MGRFDMQIIDTKEYENRVLEDFCVSLFRELNTAQIRYCVLRGFELLPRFTSNDIDIGLDAANVRQVVDRIKNIATESGWNAASVYLRTGFCRIILYHPDYKKFLLPIDLISELSYRGLRYADLGSVLEHRQEFNGFFVASPASELGISILGRCLSKSANAIKKSSRDRYRSILFDHKDLCLEFMSANAGKLLTAEILRSVENGSWQELSRYRGRLIIHIWKTHGTANVAIGVAKSFFASLRGKLSRRGVMGVRGGMFVVLLGPDGSGKSSLAHALINAVLPAFSHVKYFHSRFGVFPQLSSLFKIFRRGPHKTSLTTSAIEPRRRISELRANMNIIYYGLEYFVGNWIIWRGKMSNELIIGDRYFYDYYLHPEYKNASQTLIRLMQKLVPRPDIVFLVRCNPDIIFHRKQELAHNEILRQQNRLKDLAGILPNTHFVSTDCAIEESTAHAREVLFNAMLPSNEDPGKN